MTLRALVAGATGLVGGLLVDLLQADARYGEVTLLVRRPTGRAGGKIRERVIDFEALCSRPDTLTEALPEADVCFCALGTTLRKAGSREAFARVDRDIVLGLARAASAAGVTTFALVSALGADSRSRVFYNRVKGEAEAGVGSVGFSALHVVRPSLLVGNRAESRPLERMGVLAAPLLRALMIGPLARSAPIDARKVALALRDAPFSGRKGVVFHESSAMDAAYP
jgi:uncharacterized protein YbjT (DUF2867 family)